MAAHESPRTTWLYDPYEGSLTQDEVERIFDLRAMLPQLSRLASADNSGEENWA